MSLRGLETTPTVPAPTKTGKAGQILRETFEINGIGPGALPGLLINVPGVMTISGFQGAVIDGDQATVPGYRTTKPRDGVLVAYPAIVIERERLSEKSRSLAVNGRRYGIVSEGDHVWINGAQEAFRNGFHNLREGRPIYISAIDSTAEDGNRENNSFIYSSSLRILTFTALSTVSSIPFESLGGEGQVGRMEYRDTGTNFHHVYNISDSSEGRVAENVVNFWMTYRGIQQVHNSRYINGELIGDRKVGEAVGRGIIANPLSCFPTPEESKYSAYVNDPNVRQYDGIGDDYQLRRGEIKNELRNWLSDPNRSLSTLRSLIAQLNMERQAAFAAKVAFAAIKDKYSPLYDEPEGAPVIKYIPVGFNWIVHGLSYPFSVSAVSREEQALHSEMRHSLDGAAEILRAGLDEDLERTEKIYKKYHGYLGQEAIRDFHNRYTEHIARQRYIGILGLGIIIVAAYGAIRLSIAALRFIRRKRT